MLRIDNNLLNEIGLGGMPEAEKNGFLKHMYETLEMRVGIRLADQMSNEQLDEFERYFEAKDDAGAFKWLETNFPNYKDIVQQEFDKLKAEVAQAAPQIMAGSQAQAQQAAQAPAAQPAYPPAQAAPVPDPYQTSQYQQMPAADPAQVAYQQPAPQPMPMPPPPAPFPPPPPPAVDLTGTPPPAADQFAPPPDATTSGHYEAPAEQPPPGPGAA